MKVEKETLQPEATTRTATPTRIGQRSRDQIFDDGSLQDVRIYGRVVNDEEIADIVYIEPLTVDSLSRIIERERPDGLLPTLGGQTALNLAVELADQGILDKYDVRLLGTPLETIRKAEDRQLFREIMIKIGEPVLPFLGSR